MNDIIVALESISEQLSDRALQMLHEAVSSGAGARPIAEKSVTQARRAVEKAISILRQIED